MTVHDTERMPLSLGKELGRACLPMLRIHKIRMFRMFPLLENRRCRNDSRISLEPKAGARQISLSFIGGENYLSNASSST